MMKNLYITAVLCFMISCFPNKNKEADILAEENDIENETEPVHKSEIEDESSLEGDWKWRDLGGDFDEGFKSEITLEGFIEQSYDTLYRYLSNYHPYDAELMTKNISLQDTIMNFEYSSSEYSNSEYTLKKEDYWSILIEMRFEGGVTSYLLEEENGYTTITRTLFPD